jgi:threonine synthase
VVYATAHPAKFHDIVEPEIAGEVPVPVQLSELLHKESVFTEIGPDYHQLFS